jgi:hypothetical protein
LNDCAQEIAMQPNVRIAAALLLVGLTPAVAWSLGEERFGNEPLSEANYRDWPGVVRAVNHPARVYSTWVNGNEHCYYSGDTADLNDFLQAFSRIEGKTLEVVLRPGPCEAQTFDGQAVLYDWVLHLVGGITRHMTTRDQGENVWPAHPVVTICIGEKIKLDELKIPERLQVIGLDESKKRHAKALESKDKTVRGWSAGALAHLDPYDATSAAAIAKLLQDEDNWIKLNAVGALEHYGTTARAALPALRNLLPTKDEQLAKRVESAIEQLENHERDPKLASAHKETLEEIRAFLKARREK